MGEKPFFELWPPGVPPIPYPAVSSSSTTRPRAVDRQNAGLPGHGLVAQILSDRSGPAVSASRFLRSAICGADDTKRIEFY